jgi:RNA polymerase sigma-70 factor (ECF subfamily)
MTNVDRESELALIARLRDGDPAAFDAAHALFHKRLFNFLARLCRRRDLAEDLLEETWLRLVARAVHLRSDTRLGPWLFTVARNLYRSHCRARLVEESHAAGLMGLWPFGAPQPSPFEVSAAGEIERRLEGAIAALPLASREALLLVPVEGLDAAEAAAICGVSVEALRQRLHRARVLVARRLEGEPGAKLASLREAKA